MLRELPQSVIIELLIFFFIKFTKHFPCIIHGDVLHGVDLLFLHTLLPDRNVMYVCKRLDKLDRFVLIFLYVILRLVVFYNRPNHSGSLIVIDSTANDVVFFFFSL